MPKGWRPPRNITFGNPQVIYFFFNGCEYLPTACMKETLSRLGSSPKLRCGACESLCKWMVQKFSAPSLEAAAQARLYPLELVRS